MGCLLSAVVQYITVKPDLQRVSFAGLVSSKRK